MCFHGAISYAGGWKPVQGRDFGRPTHQPEDVKFFFAYVTVFETDAAVTFRISLFLDEETSSDARRFWANLSERLMCMSGRVRFEFAASGQEFPLGTALVNSCNLGLHLHS